MTTSDLLFAGQPRIGKFFSEAPLRVGLLSSAFAIGLLILPAWILNVRSAQGLPFLYKLNWSVMYPVVIPVIFAVMSWLCHQMRTGLNDLVETGVIVRPDAERGRSFGKYMAEALEADSKGLFWFAAGVTVAIMTVDTYDVWCGYYNGGFKRAPDWETAFKYWPNQFRFQAINPYFQNLAFTIIAYSMQAAVAFLSLDWIGTYWLFLKHLANVIRNKNAEFQFKPIIHDQDNRLGLLPLAPLFNGFLILTMLFQIYAVYHRLQQHELYEHESIPKYVASFFKSSEASGSPKVKQEGESKIDLKALLNVTSLNYSWKSLAHVSSLLPLILFTIPLTVVGFLPLGVMYFSVRRLYMEEYKTNIQNYNKAMNEGRMEEAKRFKARLSALKQANIWPNGDVAGWTLLGVIVILAIGAWFPPLLALLLSSGILAWGWKIITKRKKESAASLEP